MRTRINKIKRLENESIEEYIKRLNEAGQVVPATDDYVFKAILSKEENHNILCFLVSNIIGLNYEYVKEKLVLKNSELLKNNYLEKGMITDLLLGMEGLVVNIEMQVEDSKPIRLKNNLYHHKLRIDNKKDVDIKIYQIVFNKKRKFTNLVNEFMMQDTLGNVDEENFIRYQISLDNVSEKYYNNLELSRLEKVLMMINSYSIKELDELSENDEELRKMDELIKEMSKDPNFLAAGVIDIKEQEEDLRRWTEQVARREGLEKGHEEGLKKGKEEGIKEGIKEGKLETQKEMVIKMHENGATLDFICKTSGLSKQEILNIINKDA